jgi:hypothetical protein
MKDKLEKYVSENRQMFDDQEPGDELWNKISTGIEPSKVRRINWPDIIWRAAVVLIIFTASYFFHDFVQNRGTKIAKLTVKNTETIFIKRKVNTLKEQEIIKPVIVQSSTLNTSINVAANTNNTNSENGELAEVQAYYTHQISDRENEIYKYAAFDPNIKTQLKVEFNQLDSIYNSLRRDLKDNIDNREVVEAMIQNYRIRLEILENMLQQLKGNESTEKKKSHYEI